MLEKLRHTYPIVDDVLCFRQYTKLKSTYVDGLMKASTSATPLSRKTRPEVAVIAKVAAPTMACHPAVSTATAKGGNVRLPASAATGASSVVSAPARV